MIPRRALLATALVTPFVVPPARAQERTPFRDRLAGAPLLQALRQGGLIVFIRHTATERDGADQVSAVMGDCSTQRMLSEKGWQDAKAIGAAFSRLRIPVGDVVTSEYCRAWQTAEIAFGRHVTNAAMNFEPAEDYSTRQTRAMRFRMRPLLAALPAAGTNTVLVGHDDPFEAATGIYPEPMGVAFILRPDGRGGFSLLAHLKPEDWALLETTR